VRCGGDCKGGRKAARGFPIGVAVGVFTASGGDGMAGKGLGLSGIVVSIFRQREEETLEERNEDTGDEPVSEEAGRSKGVRESFVLSGVALTFF
jgi:hypothetical protein